MLNNILNYKMTLNLLFLILFPFFFIYSVLLAHNLIVYIPGYFSLFSIFTIIFIMMKNFSYFRKKNYTL